ncbi:hypothetical protein K440DRAFT_651252 [Wilcoxina mikolae CBS 423.85]|nr:hypothetical protein K440DRAFT_651252 [Wilcoxina mikolae CBS 423.85]
MQSIVLALLAFGATLPTFTAAAFNESQISLATRRVWCKAQVSQCPALCADSNKSTTENECYPENLFYSCVCSDGLRPNLTEYSETIPYYVCTIEQGQCITACGAGNNDCAEQCRKTNVCGATHPKTYNATASASASGTASPSATGTGSSSDSGFATVGGGSSGSSSNTKNAAGALFLQVGHAYGMGAVAAGIAVGVAFVGL